MNVEDVHVIDSTKPLSDIAAEIGASRDSPAIVVIELRADGLITVGFAGSKQFGDVPTVVREMCEKTATSMATGEAHITLDVQPIVDECGQSKHN